MKENKFRVYCEIEFEGKITKCMESPASWFLLSQIGKLWTYGIGHIPHPLEKEYKKAIPLFYTGKKDVDKVEIFEGDIVKTEDGAIGEIFYDEDNMRFWSSNNGHINKSGFCEELLFIKPRVIGNKYENPELLEERI